MLLQKLQRDKGIISCVLLGAKDTVGNYWHKPWMCVWKKPTLTHRSCEKSTEQNWNGKPDLVYQWPRLLPATGPGTQGWGCSWGCIGQGKQRRNETLNSICEDLTKVSLDTTITHNCVLLAAVLCRPEVLLRQKHKVQEHEIVCRRRLALFCLAYPSSNFSRSRQYCPKVVSRFSLSFLSIYVTYVFGACRSM